MLQKLLLHEVVSDLLLCHFLMHILLINVCLLFVFFIWKPSWSLRLNWLVLGLLLLWRLVVLLLLHFVAALSLIIVVLLHYAMNPFELPSKLLLNL